MTNLILASKREVKSGRQMWHVYRLSENNKSEEFYFAEVGKAVRYMFLIRKRGGGIIPKAVYTKIMAEYKASKPAEPTAEVVEPAPMKGKARKATSKRAKKGEVNNG